MPATDYQTTIIIYVRHLGGSHLPLSAHQAVSAVEEAFGGEAVELIPGKLYAGADRYGTPVFLTGFEKVTSAIKRDHLKLGWRDDVNSTAYLHAASGVPADTVIPVIVTLDYNVPWQVHNIAGKAWDQILAALRGEDTRYQKFLTVNDPTTVDDYFGSDGDAVFVVDAESTSAYIDALIEGLEDAAKRHDAGECDCDSDGDNDGSDGDDAAVSQFVSDVVDAAHRAVVDLDLDSDAFNNPDVRTLLDPVARDILAGLTDEDDFVDAPEPSPAAKSLNEVLDAIKSEGGTVVVGTLDSDGRLDVLFSRSGDSEEDDEG